MDDHGPERDKELTVFTHAILQNDSLDEHRTQVWRHFAAGPISDNGSKARDACRRRAAFGA
jgi:hypothetical protein